MCGKSVPDILVRTMEPVISYLKIDLEVVRDNQKKNFMEEGFSPSGLISVRWLEYISCASG